MIKIQISPLSMVMVGIFCEDWDVVWKLTDTGGIREMLNKERLCTSIKSM